MLLPGSGALERAGLEIDRQHEEITPLEIQVRVLWNYL